ncbi:MAG: GTP 3',8-cyclase MoaA [Planctomycetota bacterium]
MPVDRLGRPLRNLRISVTDRCNLRCTYCMPERDYVWLPKAELLTFAELGRLVRVFAGLGVQRLRLTGGEPLLRSDLPVLLEQLAAVSGIADVALTTNGTLLPAQAASLAAAGLRRVTVSLDSLRPDRFRQLTGRDELAAALAGIDAAVAAGLRPLKINTVVIRGGNDDELVDLVEFARRVGGQARFIEYMDVGGATHWSGDQVVPRREIIDRLGAHFGGVAPGPASGSAPADEYVLPDGTLFGVISSTTEPFCAACDRARLTADGRLYLCLYARHGVDLRSPLREGATDAELAQLIGATWLAREARGAEERLALAHRRPLAAAPELRRDPHLEMHTRGG